MSDQPSPGQAVIPARASTWSARYATPTLVVLLLALVPTIVNSYVGRKVVETPALTDALPATLDGRPSTPTRRKASTIQREFASEDWVERTYTMGLESPVTVLAVRSYDMKRLYHHPELAVTEREYENARLTQVQGPTGAVDIHLLPGMQGGMAAYALVYRGRTIASPYLFQIRVAPELLITGQRPLTLVFAEDPAGNASAAADQSPAVRSIVAAVAALAAATPH
jgi:hypothetical protein